MDGMEESPNISTSVCEVIDIKPPSVVAKNALVVWGRQSVSHVDIVAPVTR